MCAECYVVNVLVFDMYF